MSKYIVRNPEIMSGQPCVVGTRIPISRVLFLIKQGYTLKRVQQEYPHVALEIFQEIFDELAEAINKLSQENLLH